MPTTRLCPARSGVSRRCVPTDVALAAIFLAHPAFGSLVDRLPAIFLGSGCGRVFTSLQIAQLGELLAVTFQPLHGEITAGDSRLHAAARLALVRAVAKAARRGEFVDIRESRIHAVGFAPQTEFAHARRIDDDAAAGDQKELAMRG